MVLVSRPGSKRIMKKTIKKILIIDDHRLFADGLSLMLSQLNSSLNIDTKYNARKVLDDIDTLADCDLILIDLDMPNLDGLDFLRALNHQRKQLKVLVVSGSEEIPSVEHALRLGAKGFAPKSLPPKEMLMAINQVLANNLYLPRHIAESVDWLTCRPEAKTRTNVSIGSVTLRPRQLEVLRLIRDGHSNANIGTILGISESAVKTHVSNLFSVLQTRNRTAAIKVGIELGLI